jgi:hypothetical protein
MAAPSGRWAAAVVVPADFLNALAAHGIGEGVVAPPFRNIFSMPMLGPIELSVAMTIVSVSFEMRAGDGDRLRATVRAHGEIDFHGDVPMVMDMPAAVVAGEVLVEPVVELRPDGSFIAQLDLPGSELVDMTFEGFVGMESDVEAQAQMSQMLLAAVGGELFEGLAEALGPVGLELEPERGAVIADLGVAVGRADVSVYDGALEVGLPSIERLEGAARAVPVDGHCVGVGIASGALTALAVGLATEQLGATPFPFELDVSTSDAGVGGRLRSVRLTDSRLIPDLRTGIRTTVAPRLDGDEVVLELREAWLELPLVPDVVNRVNRWLGGVAARVPRALLGPVAVRLPARGEIPARPDSDVTMSMAVVDLQVDDAGVEVVVASDIDPHRQVTTR